MDLWLFLLEIVMLLGSAFLLGAIAQRLRQSPIVGYLLAGTIVGPLLFNTEVVNQSAELGVSLLLFSIGLEFSFKRLRQMGRMAFGGGTAQVTLTLTFVALLLLPWADGSQAMTIGAIVALSSTAVVMRVLVDRSEIDSVRGRACLAILLLQDIAIVPLVLMVSLLSPQTVDQTSVWLRILKIAAAAGGLGLILYLLLYRLVPVLLARPGVFANRELTVLLAMAVGLGASWGAHALNISPALGAFVAGMLLGESPFAAQIRADIGAMRTIMVTLFFASVGMLAKPVWFLSHIHWILTAALIIFVVKAVIASLAGRLFGLDNRHALAMGITLGQVGEFSFVLASAARVGGILNNNAFDLIVSVIIVLMFAAPYMVGWAFPVADGVTALFSRRPFKTQDTPSLTAEPAGQVLVVGMGPAGQEVVRHLVSQQVTPVMVDINPRSREKAFELGIESHLGDAANDEILAHIGLGKFCMAVVTVPDPLSAVRIVQSIRRLMPTLPIAARCRYNRHLADITKAGAAIVVDEETVTGHQLAHQIVKSMQDASGASLACALAGQAVNGQNPQRPAKPEVS